MSTTVRNRIEALEQRTGAGLERIMVLTACPKCGVPVPIGDRHPCNDHRSIPAGGYRILITFRPSTANDEGSVEP